ncbi:MAG: hypothetical protein RQ736_00060 [Thiogranum sp.]|nr:hypothetical protein [Thiogranum sp.]
MSISNEGAAALSEATEAGIRGTVEMILPKCEQHHGKEPESQNNAGTCHRFARIFQC